MPSDEQIAVDYEKYICGLRFCFSCASTTVILQLQKTMRQRGSCICITNNNMECTRWCKVDECDIKIDDVLHHSVMEHSDDNKGEEKYDDEHKNNNRV